MARWLILGVVLLAGCATHRPSGPVVSGTDITVHLTSFAFTPDRLQLQAGRPVSLHLINDSGGGHDFSAPELFAASAFPAQGVHPVDGAVELKAGEQTTVMFTPQKPGRYPVECTHFLHADFGMTGEVAVEPGS